MIDGKSRGGVMNNVLGISRGRAGRMINDSWKIQGVHGG
jgi:hypothetical protein